MYRIHRILALGLGTVLALLGPIAATAQETVVSAFIRSGECAKPGVVVANLTPATLPDGPAVGNTAAPVAVQSFTVAPVASAAIFGAPSIVSVADPADPASAIACGAIGGFLTDDGALVVGIADAHDSGVHGIAYLAPAPDAGVTNVSLFLSGDALVGSIGAGSVGPVVVTDGGSAESSAAPPAEPGKVTPKERAYIAGALPIISDMENSLQRMSALMLNPRIGQNDWTVAVVVEIVTWKDAYDRAQQLTPPPALAPVHEVFLEALRLYAQAGDDLTRGIDNLDVAAMQQAATKVQNASELIGQATDLLNQYREERGL